MNNKKIVIVFGLVFVLGVLAFWAVSNIKTQPDSASSQTGPGTAQSGTADIAALSVDTPATGDSFAVSTRKDLVHPYVVVSTGVTTFYDNTSAIPKPAQTSDFFAQDAEYQLTPPSYTDNGDGTVTDNNTGLMWQKDMGQKMTLAQAQEEAKNFRLGGYSDWRVANIKELYSLILFTGEVGSGQKSIKPFIDTKYFNQPLGGNGTAIGDRQIDAQTLSSTIYTGLTMGGDKSIFGVNFIDGRIKSYPVTNRATGQLNEKYFRLVRGDTSYGENKFVDNGDGTVTDLATGLMWQKADSGYGMDWEHALAYASSLKLGGHSDWRLPSAKELQSIVDYSRSPDATGSPAIDPVFQTTRVTDPDGKADYPYFWTNTTHLDSVDSGSEGVYVAFGRALGKVNGILVDAHGAGAQRSDPKTGNKSDYPQYFGPQGDMRVVFNYVRAVRLAN